MIKKFVDFGFKKVLKSKKNEMVESIFHSVSEKYDLINDIISFGVHRIWKRFLVRNCDISSGQNILDLACGTGDLSIEISKVINGNGKIILVDINSSMLRVCRNKLRNFGLIKNIQYIQADAESLPFIDNYFDYVILSFGLRNITNKSKALKSIFRVLKFGGKLIVLEFSLPSKKIFKYLYEFYSFYILPYITKFLVNDFESYIYLAESIRVFSKKESLSKLIESSGFKRVFSLDMTNGIVSLYKGIKI